jgi:selenocysteine lyase/cysteine desulfurase
MLRLLNCQKHLFDLSDEVIYLNGAYMSPLLKSVEEVGVRELRKKLRPYEVRIDDFFQPVNSLRQSFAKLINAPEAGRVAVIPSVSYGIANAARNISLSAGQEILLLEEQFPSNYYIWKRKADEANALLRIIKAPSDSSRGDVWSELILDAINPATAVVAMAHVHWADGSVFDLEAIGSKARSIGAAFVIDGTQSVGALPFDVASIQPDALICAGYKWLLGPYGIGLAFYNERFDSGIPIEENWINRADSSKFENLVKYQDEYQPFAARYNMGEQSNFTHVAMLNCALTQILDWGVAEIQDYCKKIAADILPEMEDAGALLDKSMTRASHLFGVRLGPGLDGNTFQRALAERNISVSVRGNAIRVAPYVYNTEDDFRALAECFRISMR